MTMDSAPAMMATATESLSADEIALYDRQLRLWGIEAQNRMRKANILLITIRALGNEIAKNLVLAGIGSLTILDADNVSQADVVSQFFVTEEHFGRNRGEASSEDVQRLNPRVRVMYDTATVSSKQSAFFEQFDVIIATDIPFSTMLLLNDHSRLYNIPFYAASLHGLIGIVFVDIIKYSYLVVKQKPDSQPETILKTEIYEPLRQSISTPYGKSLKSRQARKVSHLLPLSLALLSWMGVHKTLPTVTDVNAFFKLVEKTTNGLFLPSTIVTLEKTSDFIAEIQGPDLSGVASVVGGILAQDVLNVLAGKEPPLKNWLIFDGNSCDGKIFVLLTEPKAANGDKASEEIVEV